MSIDDDIRSAFADHDDEMAGRAASWPAIESGIRRRARRAAVVAPAVVVASIALLSLGAWNLVSRDTLQTITPAETNDTGFLILRQDGALELRDASGKLKREVLPADESVGYRYKLSASRATGMAYFAVLNDAEDCGDRMFSVDIATSELREIGRGRAPAVSPDGRWLAYGSFTGAGATCRTEGIRLRELATGDSRLWSPWSRPIHPKDPPPGPLPPTMSWGSDSETLAYNHASDRGDLFTTFLHTSSPDMPMASPTQPLGTGAYPHFVRLVDPKTLRVIYEKDGATFEFRSPLVDVPHRHPPISGYDIDDSGQWVLLSSPDNADGVTGSVSRQPFSAAPGAELRPLITAGSFGEVVWYD